MSTANLEPVPTLPTPEVIQHVLLGGDLSKLTPAQRVGYYKAVCESLGLNPLTRPFDYLRLSGREVLYAKKDAAEQLRLKHKISLGSPRAELLDGIYTVSVEARMPDGRTDADLGAVDLGATKGEARANAMMKAVTKAKRRVTLSICGLGMLDESEIENLPDASRLNFDPATGAIDDELPPPIERPRTPRPKRDEHRPLSPKERGKLFAMAEEFKWGPRPYDRLRTKLRDAFGVDSTNDLRSGDLNQVFELIRRGPPAPTRTPGEDDLEVPF